MPLTELLRMISGKVDSNQERASNSSDPSPRPETDFCELVWENGHVMMQGQSSKTGNQSHIRKFQDGRDANRLKMNNFSTIDSLLGDFPSVVPSSDMGLGQDGDMVPWLSFPDAYTCEFMPELSGVTLNNISTNNHLATQEKKSDWHGDGRRSSTSLKHSDASKIDPNTVKCGRGRSSEVPQYALSSQNNVPRSGVSGITGDNAGNTHNVASRDINSSSLCAFTSLRLQKLDAGQPSTSSSFANFPYFSRPAALVKANHLSENTSKRLENDEQRCTVTGSNPTMVNLTSACFRKELGTQNPSVQASANENPDLLSTKQTDELLMAKRVTREEDVMNDTQQNHALEATTSKVGDICERKVVPVVAASSVCSGNSVDIASNERGNDLKRKLRETTESEGPSEEVEDESVGAKKADHARVSSKRIRAAEVHNLSERRRRDRINEKMRALQELIPNCNKVDKASMLDEAIEYLKTLQLQLQMFSMGAGLYMQPMMLPPGMQPIPGSQIPHFPPMGLGMGMGMGFGMNMLDVNGGMKMLPFQSPHYPIPGAAAPFHGIPGSSLQPFGHPSQGFQMSMPRASVHPIPGPPPPNIPPIGLNVTGVAGSLGASNVAPPCSQVIPNNSPNIYMNQATNQATNESIQQYDSSHDRRQAINASGTSLAANGADNAA
ncbi:hypothetical protein vseg_021555 [Gypsophila vaccaria]